MIIKREAMAKMRRLSIFQWLILQFGGTAAQYPKFCGLCGKPTKGNIVAGFSMSCECDKRAI